MATEVEVLDAEVCSALRKRLERAAAQGEDQQQDPMEGEGASEQVDPLLCQAWAFGPRGCGPNILLGADGSPSWHYPKEAEDSGGVAETRMLGRASAAMSLRLSGDAEKSGVTHTSADSQVQREALWSTIEAAVHTGEPPPRTRVCQWSYCGVAADGLRSNPIAAGFQLATVSGPLCDEPMWGVALRVEATLCGTDQREEQFGPFSGQLISATREACRAALLAAGARLVEAQYMCEVCRPSYSSVVFRSALCADGLSSPSFSPSDILPQRVGCCVLGRRVHRRTG
jgi:ribosome assembly protein 1